MIWVAIVLFAIAIICALAFLVAEKGSDVRENLPIIIAILFVASLCITGISSVTIVKPENVGVQTLFGRVNPEYIDSGIHIVNPFSSVYDMNVQTNTYWMSHVAHEGDKGDKKGGGDESVSVRSSNGLQMPVDVSVPYRLEPSAAPWVYKNMGLEWVSKILRPALSTATRRAASHYTAEEIYTTKRDEFADKTKMLLSEELNKLMNESYKGQNPPETVVIITQVLIGHVGIPDSVKSAIESKLKADQEQQAMDFTIMREKKEAERKRVEAEGIQAFQNIVSKGIDDKLLRWKGIEATLKLAESQNAKVVIIGGSDGLPILLNGTGDASIQVPPKR